MSAKDVVFKYAQRAIKDAKHTGMGVHDGNARIHYGHIQWMMDRITELEQQLQQAREESRKEAAREILLDTMITTFIAPDGMVHKRLRKKFGLEE